jgi:uncharacterized membrane protein
MNNLQKFRTELRNEEQALLESLRNIRKSKRINNAATTQTSNLTLGQKIADSVASKMGSWNFIIIQSTLLAFWIFLNITAYVKNWDPYPFILLNLALSFQAAYAAPFIMMSQNRQQDIDRQNAFNDYQVNIKAELEIELLHKKIDELRELEILTLSKTVSELSDIIKNKLK